MIDDLDEFNFDVENDKNLKYLVNFKKLKYDWPEKQINIKPKFKKKNKKKINKWFKPKNNNALF